MNTKKNRRLPFVWVLIPCISVKKNIENSNSVGIGAHKDEKIAFDPTLTHIFPILGEHEKGKS